MNYRVVIAVVNINGTHSLIHGASSKQFLIIERPVPLAEATNETIR